MWRERFDRYWRGLVLSGIGIAGIVWLAATGRLGWYVHPRYFWFTVILCGIAALALIAAAPVLLRQARSGDRADQDHASDAPHTHDTHDTQQRFRGHGRQLRAAAAAILLVSGTAAALLIAPPTTLSAAMAEQRQVNAGGGPAGVVAAGADADRDARDWAMLLKQGGGAQAEGRTADFIGFVLPGPDPDGDLFFAARFVVSCCAVDAQPLGVPILSPGWQQAHAAGSWARVSGVFIQSPDVTSDHPVVLRPYEITPIDEPDDPYVY